MKNIVTIVEEDEYLDWLDKQEGGKLIESVDSATNEKTYTFEKGSVKSKYFSYFKSGTTDFNPLADKTAPLEKLVENKLRVDLCMVSMKDWRNNSEEGTAEYNKAEEAMAQLKPLLKSARLYTVEFVDESYDNVKKAQAIVEAAMVGRSSENAEVPVDSIPVGEVPAVEETGEGGK